MELDSLYQEVILDHYKNPSHKELLSQPTIKVHHVNPSCGDEQDLTLKLSNGVIERIGWSGVGCSISQASTSIMTDLIEGKSTKAAMEILQNFTEMIQSKGKDLGDEEKLEDAVAFAGVSKFPARVKCALLGWMALKDAVVQSEGN